MKTQKKKLTRQEEFDIMKLVLDKFLWLGVAIIAYGFYEMITVTESLSQGLAILLSGAIILIILMILIVREYEYTA